MAAAYVGNRQVNDTISDFSTDSNSNSLNQNDEVGADSARAKQFPSFRPNKEKAMTQYQMVQIRQ